MNINYKDIAAIAALITGGILSMASFLDKNKRDKQKDLVGLLQDTIKAYEERFKSLEKQIESNAINIKDLSNENEVMKRILQGRDAHSLEMIKNNKEILTKVNNTNYNVEKLYSVIEQHLKNIETKV